MIIGPINLLGLAVVVLMLIPNIIYAIKNRGGKNLCTNKLMNLTEQIRRYGCIVLMCLPLGIRKFGFHTLADLFIYLGGNVMLLAAYWVVFALYLKKKTQRRAMALAVIPCCIFLLCGITLWHWLLVMFGAIFAMAHIYVTKKNLPEE